MSDASSIRPLPATPTNRVNGKLNVSPGPSRADSPVVVRSADQLDLSDNAVLLSRLRDLPAIRSDLVDRVRSEIDSGSYDTPEKLDQAVQSLVHELTDPDA